MTKITLDDAKRAISDVSPEHYFKVRNGTVLRNLQELSNALEIMNDEDFSHHVNSEKNDFANWIKYVTSDNEFFEKINSEKTISSFKEVLDGKLLDYSEAIISSEEMGTESAEVRVTDSSFETEEETINEEEDNHDISIDAPEKPAVELNDLSFEEPKTETEKEVVTEEKKDMGIPPLATAVNSPNEKKKFHFGLNEFLQGLAIGVILGIIITRIIMK